MRNVAVYPFDKITRGLVKFRDQLDFQIISVIDFVFNIGEDAGENADGKDAGIPITDDVEKALEGVDTLIINSLSGPVYLEKYMKIYREYDVDRKWRDMVLLASRKGIEIVSIHEITDDKLESWLQENRIQLTTYSKTDEEIEEFINEGKNLGECCKSHRIAIYATRGCVGKYTAQMYLLKAMREIDRKAAALITEPVGSFYEQYDADPIRFGMLVNPMRYVYYVESLAKHAERDGNNFLIFADQQSITSHNFLEEMASKIALLKAYNPDTILLVAGYEDDASIQDCIDIFRIYCGGRKPIAILIPDRVEVIYGKYEVKTKEEIETRRNDLIERFHIEKVEVVSDVDKVIDMV